MSAPSRPRLRVATLGTIALATLAWQTWGAGSATAPTPNETGPVRDALSWIFLAGGGLWCILGGIGLLRFPDIYSRTHATSMTDTLGSALILLGLVLQAGPTLVSAKLLILLALIFITGPAATHALAKAAYARGIMPVLAQDSVVETPEDQSTAAPGEET